MLAIMLNFLQYIKYWAIFYIYFSFFSCPWQPTDSYSEGWK